MPGVKLLVILSGYPPPAYGVDAEAPYPASTTAPVKTSMVACEELAKLGYLGPSALRLPVPARR